MTMRSRQTQLERGGTTRSPTATLVTPGHCPLRAVSERWPERPLGYGHASRAASRSSYAIVKRVAWSRLAADSPRPYGNERAPSPRDERPRVISSWRVFLGHLPTPET